MSSFSAEWLALRESHDLRARNPDVLDAVAASFRSFDAISVVDLASGTGSTVRAIMSYLPARQRWALVDNDHDLLALACGGMPVGEVERNAVQLDLNGNFEVIFEDAKDLITSSALLDLVSDAWMDRLARESAMRALPVYVALIYDGRIDLFPADPLDAVIVAAVNAHQRTDKGFGPALGPSAGAAAISRFEALGYSVVHGTSDWMVGTADQEIQLELLGGWAAAAGEIDVLPQHDIGDWLARRTTAASKGVSTMRVGHVDFFATPSTTR